MSGTPPAPARSPTPPAVVWHELECGAYRADLALWRELADRAGGPVLEIGAGTGRVTLTLARAGHAVTALDRDRELLEALRARAAEDGLTVEAVQADARSFALPRADFALCLVPMQTIQLLGGASGRPAFLRRAREHLRPGGVLACAILGELEPFDCADGSVGPPPDSAVVDGLRYVSSARSVGRVDGRVRIVRERGVRPEGLPPPSRPFASLHTEPGVRAVQRETIELDELVAAQLQAEGRAAGFEPLSPRTVPATEEHVASAVVMLRA